MTDCDAQIKNINLIEKFLTENESNNAEHDMAHKDISLIDNHPFILIKWVENDDNSIVVDIILIK